MIIQFSEFMFTQIFQVHFVHIEEILLEYFQTGRLSGEKLRKNERRLHLWN